ncbi:MAG: hypothetical protein IRZ28_11665 [Steroidobacteraceae bacterium]|nr:hypothetical protein [Steroidobacteraceae bacterium]
MTTRAQQDTWPELPYDAWKDTCTTLHLWTQIPGKLRLALAPWLNHSWQVPLYLTARGLTTSPIAYDGRSFEMNMDFISHELVIASNDGALKCVPLRPQCVANFHAAVVAALQEMGITVPIDERPSEVPDPVPFSQDHTHCAYDAGYAQRFWRALVQSDRVFKQFRTGFLGKASPVHFFWGAFDLAVTRFSGRSAPLHPGGVPGLADDVVREAYSHEVSSAGFWPGGGGIDFAAFYSYAYPEPEGFGTSPVQPGAAFYSDTLREFLLPYDEVRRSPDPDAMLLAFLQTTYEAAADLGKWDREALECAQGRPAVPRKVSSAASAR